MSYLVIARKYRPLTFEDVIGQEHVTTTLINAIKNSKVHHAYLLTGPRGVGKTTISRIIAKSLNCETGITPKPCGVCSNCREIDQGNSLDVREIDGASNRGIDEIRDLRDDIKFSPAKTRKKIYIIDEVHMLTNQAFNALLKTLEEPPEHAVFIFATTEINEVPATILSRCQRHDFKRVEIDVLAKSLAAICEKEGVKIDEESLIMISKAGDGSVRDSQSALDQVIASAGNEITADKTYQALGLPALDSYFDLLETVISKDTGRLLAFVDDIFGKGLHILSFIKGLTEFYRDLLILKTTKDPKILDMTKENVSRLHKYMDNFGEKDILMFIDILSQSVPKLKASPFQRIDFELVLLKILHHDPVTEIEEILKKLSLYEGDIEIRINDLAKDIVNLSGTVTARPADNENGDAPAKTGEEKKKTLDPEEFSVSEKILGRWKEFVGSDKIKNELKLSALEYGLPSEVKNNQIDIRFDPKHIVLHNFCEAKKDELETALNEFYGSKNYKIKLLVEKIDDNDRIISIRKNKTRSFEEKRDELLKRSPKLKFLFEEPFNCRFID